MLGEGFPSKIVPLLTIILGHDHKNL